MTLLQRSHGDVVVVAPPSPRPAPAVMLGALRVHQWSKNALVFIPLLAAHAVTGPNLLAATLAFLSFSLVASAIYLLNDLADLRHDRRHPSKSRRAFASGALPLSWAFPAIPGLLASVRHRRCAGRFSLTLLATAITWRIPSTQPGACPRHRGTRRFTPSDRRGGAAWASDRAWLFASRCLLPEPGAGQAGRRAARLAQRARSRPADRLPRRASIAACWQRERFSSVLCGPVHTARRYPLLWPPALLC